MAIICRLREYKLDQDAGQETGYEHLYRRAGLISAVLIGIGSLTLAFTFAGGPWRKADVVETASVQEVQREADKVAGQFASTNWGHLERRPDTAKGKVPGVQDLGSPDWANRLLFKDLKAMPVYEVRIPTNEEGDSRRMAETLSGGRKS